MDIGPFEVGESIRASWVFGRNLREKCSFLPLRAELLRHPASYFGEIEADLPAAQFEVRQPLLEPVVDSPLRDAEELGHCDLISVLFSRRGLIE